MEVGTIFEAMFLERKMVMTFLTFSRLLTESSKVACLVLALLRLRLQVLSQKTEHHSQVSESFDLSSKQDSMRTESLQMTLQKSLSTTAGTIERLATGRKNSSNLDSVESLKTELTEKN